MVHVVAHVLALLFLLATMASAAGWTGRGAAAPVTASPLDQEATSTEPRARLNCTPHSKMSQSDCIACARRGYKLSWVGTGKNGKGGCQAKTPPLDSSPFAEQCRSHFTSACNPKSSNNEEPDCHAVAGCDGITTCNEDDCSAASSAFTVGTDLGACTCFAKCASAHVFERYC